MRLIHSLQSNLSKKRTFIILFLFVHLVALILFVISVKGVAGDDETYLNYINGFQQGKYTYWHFLDNYVPDTFRNPGYPLFLYVSSLFGTSIVIAKVVQFLLFIITIGLMLRIINYFDSSIVLKNIFLILVLINFVVLSYPPLVLPETLMMFLITLLLYLEITTADYTWPKIIILALLYGFTFQVRPVIIFLPFIRCFYHIFFKKKYIAMNVLFIILFVASTLPYGYWNYKHHKTFKITPLEGGAGVMYLGYWSPKMLNHVEDRYWRNVMYQDILVNFSTIEDVPANVKRFNAEFDSVENICNSYLSEKDKENLSIMKQYPRLFETHNSKYTIVREKILRDLAVQHYIHDWKYTLKLKSFSFFRIWYTGWSLRENTGISPLLLISTVLAFFTTFITLIFFIAYLTYYILKKREKLNTIILPLFLCLYFGVLHLPFAIQSRYTIPVRLLYLFGLAFMIFNVHFKEKRLKTD